MEITMTTFMYVTGAAFVGIILLTYKMHREMKGFISELQFFLEQRTIAHNQSKAKLAILNTKFSNLESEKEQLEIKIANFEANESYLKEQLLEKADILCKLTGENEDLSAKNKKLRDTVVNLKENSVFGGLLAEAEFIEARNTQIKKLGAEISSIQEVLNGDFKTKLSQYLNEVDGLNQRLTQARDEYYSKVSKTSLDGIELDDIA